MAIPLIHVSGSVAAERFYCDQLGFKKMFAHYGNPALPDPCYMGISRDNIVLHVSSFSGDGVSGHATNLVVDNVDALFQEFLAKGAGIDLSPTNQTWGSREMYVRDADNNCIRFLQPGKSK